MKLIIKESYEQMSLLAAEIIKECVECKPNIVLGLPTGGTPKGMYKELIRFHKEGGLDFSNVTTFNLDEYVGIGREHPNSYNYFMKNIFFDHVNLKAENTFIPDGKLENIEDYCQVYDDLIEEKGGVDLQILGIGQNGHLAFNEPDNELNIGTSIVDLTQTTIQSNSRFFKSIDEVPKKAITMGIGSIMKARKIILLASGKSKTEIINKLLNTNKLTTKLPASILLLHPNVTIIVDEDAYRA